MSYINHSNEKEFRSTFRSKVHQLEDRIDEVEKQLLQAADNSERVRLSSERNALMCKLGALQGAPEMMTDCNLRISNYCGYTKPYKGLRQKKKVK